MERLRVVRVNNPDHLLPCTRVRGGTVIKDRLCAVDSQIPVGDLVSLVEEYQCRKQNKFLTSLAVFTH
jgi:hypothetical protein